MSGSLPLVRVNAQCLYPVTRVVTFATDVAIAADFSEQRAKTRPPLTRLICPYTRMNSTDLTAIRNFLESQKGPFDTTWSITLGSTTYSNLVSEDDSFEATEAAGSQTTYSFSIRARQTQNPGYTCGAPGAAFPALANGLRSQLPYTQLRRYAVMKNDNQRSGTAYRWTWFGGGLSGFPTGSLHGWQLSFPVLSDADLATIETHFRNQWGRWSSFTFVDLDPTATITAGIDAIASSVPVSSVSGFPNTPFYIQIDSEWMTVTSIGGGALTVTRGGLGTTAASHLSGAAVRLVFTKCRYDHDVLEIRHIDYGINSVTLRVMETN